MKLIADQMIAKYVFVGVELGVFEALASRTLTVRELADTAHAPQHGMRIVLDALVAAGYLRREGDQYSNTTTTRTFLAGAAGPDLRPLLRMWNQVVYEQWRSLEQSVREDRAAYGYNDFSPAQLELFSIGVEALTAPTAQALARSYDFSQHRAMLDLAGGTGSFVLAAIGRHPGLSGTVFETPASAPIIRERLRHTPRGDTVRVVEGDLFTAMLPTGHDVMLLANVVHLFSPTRNRELLHRLRAQAQPGTRLLLVDFWTNPDRTEPLFAALMAGEFLLVTGDGDVYSVEQVSEWLTDAGWQVTAHQPLAGPASLIVAM